MPTVERILIIALTVLFIHITTWKGMINEWFLNLSRPWPEWIRKPLLSCPICMTPWWGALLFLIGAVQFVSILDSIIVLFAAGGLNAVLIYVISSDKEEIKDLKEKNSD